MAQYKLLHFLHLHFKQQTQIPTREDAFHSYNEANHEFDDLKFRKTCSDLLSKFESFLILEALKDQPLVEKNLLLQQIHNKGFDHMLNKTIQNADKYYQRFPEKSANFHLRQYEKGRIQYEIDTQFDKKKNKKTSDQLLRIDTLSSNLDQFYVIEKLKMACSLATWQQKLKTKNRPFEVEIILRMLAKNKLLENPAISIYRNMYLMLTEKESKRYFEELKDMVNQHFDIFSKDEQRNIFDALISYCVGQLNKGVPGFVTETLLVYNEAISTGVILTNNELSPITFRNYIILCLRNGEYDKAETFITENASLLNIKLRENALNFNLARVHFYKGDFEDTLRYLSLVDYEDMFYNLNSRILSLATNYELSEMDVMESQIDSFNGYLQRINISQDKAPFYSNFLKYLKRLILSGQYDKKKLVQLKEQIVEESQIVNKEWLLEKVNDLL